MADHQTLKIDKANHLLLDQPLLRLPYELMRKNFRTAHFTVEHESKAVSKMLKDTATGSLNGKASQEDLLKNIDAILARAKGMKRKLAACADEESRLYQQFGARVAHIGELASMETLDDVRYEQWSRRRLDRLVVDYMLRHGYNESAAALADDRGIRDLVDIDTFVQISRIQESLTKRRSVIEALAWCHENKKELRKLDSELEFMLRLQQYIELVRSQSQPKILEAITHARKYLIPFRQIYPEKVNQAAALLAYPPGHAKDAYSNLWDLDRWDELGSLFVKTHNRLMSLPSFPLLHIALSSGLSALKTPACHAAGSRDAADSINSSMCPICSAELNELAENVPYAHHSKSHVEQDLLLLPNDRVYGKARLEEYAKKSGLPPNRVKDLRTGEIFSTSKLKRVFIT